MANSVTRKNAPLPYKEECFLRETVTQQLTEAIANIPSLWRVPTTTNAHRSFLSAEDIRDWATVEANLSELYAAGSIPRLSTFVGTGPMGRINGLTLISLELEKLDQVFTQNFPEALPLYSRNRGFRQWFLQHLDDPGFYHFVVQFQVTSDPAFVAFLWQIWRRHQASILECLRGRVATPDGHIVSVLSSLRFSDHQFGALEHFLSLEGMALCERHYETNMTYLRASRNFSGSRVIHSGPFVANHYALCKMMTYAGDALPLGGHLVFYIPVLNESLRRLSSTCGIFAASDADYPSSFAAAELCIQRVLEELSSGRHGYGFLTSRLELREAYPISYDNWGHLGAVFMLQKRSIA